ncbi:carbohydrate ABC transporter permease [Kushneria phyllosphaerae]|uniref:Lactose transport system permease protein LacF n=1 Tax=Kushneria phyllosphaerae TaxID=2100822 RepID=A0A2R8CIT1_9GAMM|nr:sugar ABC transporter permease [Kushneria phyllosphaerae]SPJ32818.1 Lactose transport system permease protein LacF [Kushneria phyllosphaerae]
MTIWRRNRSWLWPALFIAPGIILFGIVIVGSSVQSLWISFFQWDGFDEMQWIGLGNYIEMLDDPQFYISLRNNIIWLAVFMLAPPLGLFFALLINQQIRGMRIVKSLFFMPLVMSQVAVGVVFTWFYDPSSGLLALFFEAMGATAPALLSDPRWVTLAVVFAALWPQVSFCVILFMAGLNNLDESQIEAARVDNAKGWKMLWYVILPQLRQVNFIAIAVTVIGALRSFDMISVMTSGGPFGSSNVLAYQMYSQSIQAYRFGYGAAIASVLFAIMVVFISWYLWRMLRMEKEGA